MSLVNRSDEVNFKQCKEALKNCTYLEDDFVVAEGFKIYGTPYQPVFHNWGFNRTDAERQALFAKIPNDADVVLCHGPPYGILDHIQDRSSVGCQILRDTVLNRVKPKICAFGHIHEDHGVQKIDNTIFVNSANCTIRYKCSQPPEIVDLPRKPAN